MEKLKRKHMEKIERGAEALKLENLVSNASLKKSAPNIYLPFS